MKKSKGPSVSGQPEIPNVKTIESYKKMLEEANYAEKFYKKLGQSITEFDFELGSSCEVAIHLAGFDDLIIIEDMEFFNPSLICFIGRTVGGRYVKVVQHVHQINIMLTSFTRQNPQEPKRTFDFSIDISETGEH